MDRLETRMIAHFITTECNLRCRLCSVGVPFLKDRHHEKIEDIVEDIRKMFEIYRHFEHIDIIGGEVFLHPDAPKVLDAYLAYNEGYDVLRIITNSTMLMSDELIEAIHRQKNKFELLIDDYGLVSIKKDQLIEQCIKNHIQYKVNEYKGEDQHCSGWVDLGLFEDKMYTSEEVDNVYRNCHLAHEMGLHLFEGKIYHCDGAFLSSNVYGLPLVKGEYIEFRSEDISLEDNKKTAVNFGRKAINPCRYCNGFDSKNCKRYPAAQQISKEEKEQGRRLY